MSSTSFIESGLWGSWNYGVCFQATEAALVRGDWDTEEQGGSGQIQDLSDGLPLEHKEHSSSVSF